MKGLRQAQEEAEAQPDLEELAKAERPSIKTSRALKRAAELYVACILTAGVGTPRALERGALLEALAIDYADAVREEKRASRARARK